MFFDMRKNAYNKFNKFRSQLDFPFIGSKYDHLNQIFDALVSRFGLQKNSNQKLIDLGAGDGRIIIFSALEYGITSLGIEIDSNLINYVNEQINAIKKENKYSKKNIKKIKMTEGDLFELNLKKYDFIYMYVIPSLFKCLKHLILTMKKGAIIISYKYPIEMYNEYFRLEYEIDHKDIHEDFTTFFYRKF